MLSNKVRGHCVVISPGDHNVLSFSPTKLITWLWLEKNTRRGNGMVFSNYFLFRGLFTPIFLEQPLFSAPEVPFLGLTRNHRRHGCLRSTVSESKRLPSQIEFENSIEIICKAHLRFPILFPSFYNVKWNKQTNLFTVHPNTFSISPLRVCIVSAGQNVFFEGRLHEARVLFDHSFDVSTTSAFAKKTSSQLSQTGLDGPFP